MDPDFKRKQARYKYSKEEDLSSVFSTRINSIENKKELEFYQNYLTKNLNKSTANPSSINDLTNYKRKIENLIKEKENPARQGLFLDPSYRIPTGGIRSASSGFIPNFIDKRNRYQKIQDTLRDPANKNIKSLMI